MVVIGIIAIMLVAVVPAVVSLNKANSGKSAISNVMNLFEQARSLAITSGHSTYVVFADQTTLEPYRCKGYVVFQEDQNFAPVAVSKWHFLPTGISFRPNTGLLTPQSGSPILKFACPGTVTPQPSQPIALPFVKFDAGGMVTAPTNPNILFTDVFSGSVNASGQPLYTDKAQQTAQKFDSVAVARFTGRAHYVDPYAP